MSELHDALKKKYLVQKSEKPTVHKVGGSLTKSQLLNLIEQMGDDDEVFLQADWPDGTMLVVPVEKVETIERRNAPSNIYLHFTMSGALV